MRVALLGAFDVADGEHLATRRVLEEELRRRLPGCEVSAFSPLGRFLALDGGHPAEPMPRSPYELAAFAARFDCVVATGEHGTELETVCPVVRAGDALPTGGEIGALPPLSMLLARMFDPELLRRRSEFLELVGCTWPPGRVLTVQGDATLVTVAGDLAAALLPLVDCGAVAVQLGASGDSRGEEQFADTLESALDGMCRRVRGVAGLEDQVALVAGSAAYIGPPGLGLWIAVALGVPSASPAVPEPGELDGLLGEVRISRPAPAQLGGALSALLCGEAERPLPQAAITRLERHLDELAGLVQAAATRRTARTPHPVDGAAGLGAEARHRALREAHEALGRQLFAERRDAASELSATLVEARAEADQLRAELAAARAANDRMVASRTWRYTQPLREALARVRERRR